MSQNEDRRSQSAAEQALINAPLPFEDTFVSSPDEDDLREKLDKWMSNQAFEINSPDMRNILTLLARLASQSSAGEIAVHTFFVPLLVWLWSGLWETDVLMSQDKQPKLGTEGSGSHAIDSSQRVSREGSVFTGTSDEKPDILVTSRQSGASLLVCEFKPSVEPLFGTKSAEGDLNAPNRYVWKPWANGRAPYIPAVAAGRHKDARDGKEKLMFQFGVMLKTEGAGVVPLKFVRVGVPIDPVRDPEIFISRTMHLVCMMKRVDLLGPNYDAFRREGGRRANVMWDPVITPPSLVKTVVPQEKTQISSICNAYRASGEMTRVVTAEAGETFQGVSYAIRIVHENLGYMWPPRTRAELVIAISDVFIGLHELHAIPFVHRDIRWPNVVWFPDSENSLGTWMLIDLDAGSSLDSNGSAEWPSEDLISSEHLFERDSEDHWTPMSDFKMALRNLLIKWHEWVEDLPNVEKLDANAVSSVFDEVLQRLSWSDEEETRLKTTFDTLNLPEAFGTLTT